MLDKINMISRAAGGNRVAPAGGDNVAQLAAPNAARRGGIDPPTSQILATVAEIAAQPPPVDMARVANLRAAIASGEYSISPSSIARAIANSVPGEPHA